MATFTLPKNSKIRKDGEVHKATSGGSIKKFRVYRYDPDMPMCKDIANRVLKLGEFENPIGQWDSMEVIADDTMVIHLSLIHI